MMKKIPVSAIRITCFLAILCLVLHFVFGVLKPKNDDGIYDMELFYELPEDSVEVLVLGSSLLAGLIAQLIGKRVKVELYEQVVDGLGTHLGNELVGVTIVKVLVVLANDVIDNIIVLLF